MVACSRPRTSKDVLRALVLDLATEDAAVLVDTSTRLSQSLRLMADAPGPVALEAARNTWKTALLAWQRASCFQTLPLVRSNALLRATFFPVRAVEIERLARSGDAENAESAAALGVDRKGMFALELVLFRGAGATAPALCERADADGDHARRFAAALGTNVAAHARAVTQELGDGKAFAEVYAQGGHENLNHLVSEMVGTIGSMSSGRLSKALSLEAVKPGQIKGDASGTALDILVTLVRGVQRLYEGGPRGGLTELVHAASASVDASLRMRLSAAGAAIEQAQRAQSLERERAFAAAREALRSLDRSLESEFSSTLGVTLLFAGPDAD